jgi:hypothetical protein
VNDYGSQQFDGYLFAVRRQGDVDLDGDVDIIDNLLMQAATVGNQLPEVCPFCGDISLAETAGDATQYDGVLDIFDIVRHQGFIVGNSLCLTPPMTVKVPSGRLRRSRAGPASSRRRPRPLARPAGW